MRLLKFPVTWIVIKMSCFSTIEVFWTPSFRWFHSDYFLTHSLFPLSQCYDLACSFVISRFYVHVVLFEIIWENINGKTQDGKVDVRDRVPKETIRQWTGYRQPFIFTKSTTSSSSITPSKYIFLSLLHDYHHTVIQVNDHHTVIQIRLHELHT